jgi:hypothetical protein
MKPIKFQFLTLLAVSLATVSPAATLYFDFGERSTPTTNVASFYNNIDQDQLPIADCVDDLGNNTGISATPSGFNPGSNGNGTQTPTGAAAVFEPAATRDSLFGHTVNFNQPAPLPLGTIVLTGLDASGDTSYSFTFFGSRTGVADNREAKFEVVGLNTAFGLVDTANNTANVATVGGITPDGSGNVTINVSPGPNNNNTSGFFYIGAMQMVSSNAAQPVITGQPAHKTVSAGANATFTVTATSATALSYQWQFYNTNLVNGGNISGATNATLTVSGVAPTDVGHYRVLVSNNAGTVNSADATLAIVNIGFYPTVLIAGKIGDTYRVEYATALAPATWIPLSTNVLTVTPQLYIDVSSPNNNSRFYRALYVP